MPHKNAVSRALAVADERLAKSSTARRNDGGVARRPPIKEGVNMLLAFL